MAAIQEAPSVSADSLLAKALRMIPQFEVNDGCPLFKKHWMHRPSVIGMVGLPGEGKSGTAAMISLIDEMLEGRPVWSNISVKADYEISDEVAQKYGLPRGGIASFESIPLDKRKLLKFDDEYQHGAVLLDEINVEFAEARRSQSNVNLWFNELDQQRRKIDMSIYYTVIHEMWVDPRLRELTDIFIRCEDPALSPEGIARKTRLGQQVKWTIYPMTRSLTGKSYYETGKPLPARFIKLKHFWGLWDTYKRQQKEDGKYSFKMDDEDAVEGELEVKQSQLVEHQRDIWGELDEALTDIILDLQEQGKTRVSRQEILARLEVPENMRLKVTNWLVYDKGMKRCPSGGVTYYEVPEFALRNAKPTLTRELVRA